MVHFVDSETGEPVLSVVRETGEVLEPEAPAPAVLVAEPPFRVPAALMLILPIIAFAIPTVSPYVGVTFAVLPMFVIGAMLVTGMAASLIAGLVLIAVCGRRHDAVAAFALCVTAFVVGAVL